MPAEDGVAGVHGLRVALLDERDGVEDRVADVVAALVAAEDEVDVGEAAAVVDPLHDAADHLTGDQLPSPRAVPGVVGEVHRVHRPHLVPEPRQRARDIAPLRSIGASSEKK